MRQWLAVFVAGLLVPGCVDRSTEETITQQVVVGTDSRIEVYQETRPQWQQLARSSVGVFVETELDLSDPNNIPVTALAVGDTLNLCPYERFREQPGFSYATGVLVSNRIVLTAGHVLETQQQCDRISFVFGYYYDAPGVLHTLTSQDVFRCRRILARELVDQGVRRDYALIELDREATPRFSPVQLSSAEPVLGGEIVTISAPRRVPLKIDTGTIVAVRTYYDDYFRAAADVAPGSSGAPAFDTRTGALVGIITQGPADLITLPSCNEELHCTVRSCELPSYGLTKHAFATLCRIRPTERGCPPPSCLGASCVDASALTDRSLGERSDARPSCQVGHSNQITLLNSKWLLFVLAGLSIFGRRARTPQS